MAVVLLEASCGTSRKHAVALNRLQGRLTSNGLPLDIIGINARSWPARLMVGQLQRSINFTLFQSPRESNYWSQLGGLKDDVFIYDSCNRLAYFIPFPHCYTPQRFVELAIQSAHSNSPCSPRINETTVVQIEGVRSQNQRSPSNVPAYRHASLRPSANERR